ncbi:type II toxin-antitoxin system VapB family antitoxin [Actinocrispum wychmicini]|uniref:Antitoxin VapB n=1 Tax=Actinocrispum wychmicini TaxID=1213861 RepID=A0A4R2JAP7_9PSEU|nr:type II toxin-antitoxin system VapB family antitoxin [Actinocrispum wychmicini]TCO53059.1 antitoxin VapB [Actinocrispum wychmicini]
MAMNIKDNEAERLATEVAELTGETKTAAVRTSLRERRDRLVAQHDFGRRLAEARRFLEDEIWSQVPADELGKPITKAEREEILGYGPDGV